MKFKQGNMISGWSLALLLMLAPFSVQAVTASILEPPLALNQTALDQVAQASRVPTPIVLTQRAPEWDVSEWINGPGTTLAQLHGKVVIVEFFQLWCPGCNKFSIPLMKQWQQKFAGEIRRGEMVMLSIHTVFEGHDYQNPKRLKAFVKEKGIHHLVGIDRQMKGEHLPETMKAYRTRGTPEMAIIDRQGNIRFQKFGGFDPARVEVLIQNLLNEKSMVKK
ncbi:MAG: TlpA family protein disulfide reductase [Mariprofundaceae bacterium]